MSRKTKIRTIAIISALVCLMVITAYFTTKFGGDLTGAISSKNCECISNESCDDNDPCTEDICLYPENCLASKCIHIEKEECKVKKNN